MSAGEWSPVGRRIVAVRSLTKANAAKQGWDEGAWQWSDGVQLVLDDGSILIPSADWEGNGCGALFGLVKQEPVFVEPVDWPSRQGSRHGSIRCVAS